MLGSNWRKVSLRIEKLLDSVFVLVNNKDANSISSKPLEGRFSDVNCLGKLPPTIYEIHSSSSFEEKLSVNSIEPGSRS